MQRSVQYLEKFLAQFRAVRQQEEGFLSGRLIGFLGEFRPVYQHQLDEWRKTASRFNVFTALGIEGRELSHSAFIAHLLNPRGSHDQGARFLEAFLSSIDPGVFSDVADIGRTRVSTEYCLGDQGRIDILVELADRRVVLIENKVYAGERENQVGDYQNWVRAMRPDVAARCLVVFLSPGGRTPETLDLSSGVPVRPWSYADLAAWLIGIPDLPPRLASVINMYTTTCRAIELGE